MVDQVNTKILSFSEFERDSGLKSKYKSYNEYFSSQLKTTSIHNFSLSSLKSSKNPSDMIRDYFNQRYEKFNAKSEQLIANYQALAPLASAKKAEYNKYATKVDGLGDNAKLSEKSKLFTLKNEANLAEYQYDAALDLALYHTHSATQFLG